VLAAERRPWLAIDPKGAIGEPAYDIAYLIANRSSYRIDRSRPLERMVADRIDFLPDALGLDRQRVAAYAFAQCGLDAWWTLEDHGEGWEPIVAMAAVLEPYVTG
jgi:streptomycin 6-kinase